MVPLVERVTPWPLLWICICSTLPSNVQRPVLSKCWSLLPKNYSVGCSSTCRDLVPQFSVNSWGQVDEPSAQLKNISLDIVFVSVGKLLLQKRRECPYSFALRLTKTWGFSSSLQLHRRATKDISQKKEAKTKQNTETSSKMHCLS